MLQYNDRYPRSNARAMTFRLYARNALAGCMSLCRHAFAIASPLCVTAVAAAFLLAPARSQQLILPPTFPPTTLSGAKLLAGGLPFNLRIVHSLEQQTKNLASVQKITSPTGSVTYRLVLYISKIRERFGVLPAMETMGVLAGLFMHEMGHVCMMDYGSGIVMPDSGHADFTCEELAVLLGEASQECHKVEELNIEIQEQTDIAENPNSTPDAIAAAEQKIDDLTGQKDGLCSVYDDVRKQLNSEDAAKAAKQCLCAQPPMTVPVECIGIVGMPSFPPGSQGCSDSGSGFPNNEMLTACTNCPPP